MTHDARISSLDDKVLEVTTTTLTGSGRNCSFCQQPVTHKHQAPSTDGSGRTITVVTCANGSCWRHAHHEIKKEQKNGRKLKKREPRPIQDELYKRATSLARVKSMGLLGQLVAFIRVNSSWQTMRTVIKLQLELIWRRHLR